MALKFDEEGYPNGYIVWAMGYISDIIFELEGKDFVVVKVNPYGFDAKSKNLSNPFLAAEIIKERLDSKYPKKFKTSYQKHGAPDAHIEVKLI